MVPQEKYDILIDYVEEVVHSRAQNGPEEHTIDAKQTAADAIRAASCDGLRVDEIFKFTENETFEQYIRDRLLMHVYDVLLTQDEYELDALMDIAGYNDDKALYRVFRDKFGINPKVAFDDKRRDLYKEPRHWDELSTIEREVITNEIEVIKEVPVFNTVVKVDRKPYVIVGAIIAVIIIGILGIRAYNIKTAWEGEYIINRLYQTEDGGAASESLEGTVYKVSKSGKKVELIEQDQVVETYQAKVNKGVISWIDSNNNKYYGERNYEGSVYLIINDDELNNFYRLVKVTDNEQWAAFWSGTYEAFAPSDDGWMSQTWENVDIMPRVGFMVIDKLMNDPELVDDDDPLSIFNDEPASIGRIIYFGPDYLIAYFPDSEFGLIQCVVTGEETINICDKNTDEVLRKCMKIYSDSKL